MLTNFFYFKNESLASFLSSIFFFKNIWCIRNNKNFFFLKQIKKKIFKKIQKIETLFLGNNWKLLTIAFSNNFNFIIKNYQLVNQNNTLNFFFTLSFFNFYFFFNNFQNLFLFRKFFKIKLRAKQVFFKKNLYNFSFSFNVKFL